MKLKTIKELDKDNCRGCMFDSNNEYCNASNLCGGVIWVLDTDPRPEIEPQDPYS